MQRLWWWNAKISVPWTDIWILDISIHCKSKTQWTVTYNVVVFICSLMPVVVPCAVNFIFSKYKHLILQKLKVPHHVHKSTRQVPAVSQINPVYTLTSHFFKSHVNIILPSVPRPANHVLPLRFPHQSMCFSSLPCTSCPMTISPLVWLFWLCVFSCWRVQVITLNYANFSNLMYLPLLVQSSSSAPIPCSGDVTNQVSHPYKTA